ncbi:MAG: DNA polymerase III subunit gamma/tau [Clostridia bacterium]|nr:DNA polymerase III subunit gamma/tau [Clostridia bacterium]
MSYTALYRKFRPTKFSEIVGQEHITRTLKNQIIANRVGHAYLLTGGRGTGKTSAAKILARAINCINPQDGEPCNECEICKSAIQGSLTDIVEMDAASNNSVEDIRAIREEVNFLPTVAKYRVYIIDEVHMLSVGAFNALLKTLEEPPKHVKFILATTEPQKLPATILSRCQRFDYKKISPENIKLRLEFICKESKIDITEDALNTISVLAEGAMRDALSILERCVQEGETRIDDDRVKELVGIPKVEYINKIVRNVIECNVDETLKSIDEVINDGKDLNNLIWEIIKYVKDILVFKSSGKLNLYNEHELIQIKEIADKTSKERLLDIIYSLSELASDLKMTTQKTIMLEVGVMKLCITGSSNESKNCNMQNTPNHGMHSNSTNTESNGENISNPTVLNNVEQVPNNPNSAFANTEMAVNSKELEDRIKKLEEKINKVSNLVVNSSYMGVDISSEKATPKRKAVTRNVPNGITNIVTNTAPTGKKVEGWNKLVNGLKESGKIMLYTNLMNTTATEENDMTVGIVFKNGITPFGRSILDKPESINELSKLVSLEYGKPMQVKYIDASQQEVQEDVASEISKEIGMPVNIIED